MVRTLCTDEIILLKVKRVDQVPAVGTLGPKIIGKVVVVPLRALEPWFVEDAHVRG